jgi:hypothetical protein
MVMIEEDTTDEIKIRVHAAQGIYAPIEIPTGFKATAAMVYGSDTANAVSCSEGNINAAGVTAKGAGVVGTEIDITDVTATDTNFLWVHVELAANDDYIYGGYVTIEKA